MAEKPIHRMIAAAMVASIMDEPEFTDLIAEQVADPKRKLREMAEGDIVVDCIGVGMRTEPGNRRGRLKIYTTHAAIRSKLPGGSPTEADLDRLGLLAEQVQLHFEALHSLRLEDDSSAKLIGSEPFVHVVRSQLFGDGLFTSPIQFTWQVL